MPLQFCKFFVKPITEGENLSEDPLLVKSKQCEALRAAYIDIITDLSSTPRVKELLQAFRNRRANRDLAEATTEGQQKAVASDLLRRKSDPPGPVVNVLSAELKGLSPVFVSYHDQPYRLHLRTPTIYRLLQEGSLEPIDGRFMWIEDQDLWELSIACDSPMFSGRTSF